MDLLALLKPLEQLERRMGELYDWYADLFASDKEASGIFFRLALEEQRHARMIDHVRRLARQNAGLASAVDADLATVHEALDRVRRIRASDAPLDLAIAVRLAIELEQTAAEAHYRQVIADTNPDLGQLLHALSRDDRSHQSMLEKLAIARGL